MQIDYIKSDLCRYVGKDNINFFNFAKNYAFNTGFKFSFWFRLTQSKNPLVSALAKVQRRRFSKKYMLEIPSGTKIGYGLYIGHGQCVVINPTAIIGNNINLSQFTSIGSNSGNSAIIGDNVYIGPNVCIVENVKIGSNVRIGAGSVVIKDIPDNAVAAGVPAKVIKIDESSNAYVARRW
ncbi:serine acetyltransferase [Psychrobacter faecalis]|uniref:Serine acetyltransferase n=1 Tax=Psychrobacter faecalis TaxID=180588 RepID=A0ABT9HJ88_9GAMM|nr:serine acetyltransferase [Psychrobacter faecalis]MDP4545829.1 serine acetyltransferase [Psychrobacter faecalis]